jgi:nitroreductase
MKPETQQHLDFIMGRRSIRAYRPGEIDDDTVNTILEIAMAAPSAVAKDPWRFVVIRKPETLSRIADILPNGQMLATATVGIAVCGDITVAHDRQLSYLLQDCAAAIQNLLLAVHAFELGACWLGVHPREERIRKVSEILGLPETVIPVSCIAIGHPDEVKEGRTRYSSRSVHWESWGGAQRGG